ncbi:MAG: hypothetical protein QOJ29_785 [Thermoleophilaceae bacterium]|jgi:PAS domain S-box-containing protein|nr:hypothetical protein [Thermoleophilaceae bacterium]
MRESNSSECERWRGLFESAPTGIALVAVSGDERGCVVEANSRLATLTGRKADELVGLPALDLLHQDERIRAREDLARLVAGAVDVVDADSQLLSPDGESRNVRVSARALLGGDGSAEAVMVHVLELPAVRAKRLQAAERLERAQEIAQIGSFEWAPQTDTLVMSDELFRLFGLRPGSLPGRLTAFEPLLHRDDVATLMDAITSTLADGQPRSCEFRFRRTGNGLRWAEARLAADRDGAGVVARLWGTMQDIHERRLGEEQLRDEVADLEQVAEIRAAVAEGRLRIDAQEIIDVASGELALHELLVRMVARDGSLLQPCAFLPLAERYGVIEDIDRWVLEQAVELAAGGEKVAVNVSARTMSDDTYADDAMRLLADRGAAAAHLTFEITETALIEDFDRVRVFAGQVEALGCRLALDDFGTGFGALTYIKKLPAHFLKIDREFVADLESNPRSRAVVRGVINLAKSFGQKTIAEGVEDARTLALLNDLGVDYAQGYHIARPCWIAGAGRGAGS